MKRLTLLATVFMLLAGMAHAELQMPGHLRHEECFNFDWKFQKGGEERDFRRAHDDARWETVQLPHDASIYGPFEKEASNRANGWRPQDQGWYRKTFTLPAEERGRMVYIEFEGVYRDARVWINEHYLGRHLNGYLGFEHDLTPHIDWDGENVIAVHYDNRTPGTSRWYTGEGIYRNVWLKTLDPLHVPLHGTYVTTPNVTEHLAVVAVETEVINLHPEDKQVTLVTTLKHDQTEIAVAKATAPVAGGETYIFRQHFEVRDPNLWDVDNPNLYVAGSRVYDGNTQTDKYATQFGIREVRLTPDQGLLLNGKRVFAVGGDLHHDLGCLGAATFRRGYEKRLLTLKEMGCNSVRLSHNPHASMFLDLCDELGILVIDELYDKWTSQFYGGEASFADMWQADLEHFIRRDRNHPSVYLWSMGNEVLKQHGRWDEKFETKEDGADYGVGVLKEMVEFTRRMEPTRKVTCALYPLRETGLKEWEQLDNHEAFMAAAPPPMAFHMDVVSWNYMENLFDLDHQNYPQMMFIASESSTNLGLPVRRNSWLETDRSYVVGYYYWTAWDYLGESTWPQKTWSNAFYDLNERMNPLGAMYRAFYSEEPFVQIWVDYQDEEMLEKWDKQFTNKRWNWRPMTDHWNWEAYKTVKVTTFTNCDEVELFLNDRSLGIKKQTDREDRLIEWDIPYQPGTIRAVAANNGAKAAGNVLKTAGDPVKIILEPDRTTMTSSGSDIAYVQVSVVDENGVVVPDADRSIQFEVEGAGVNAGVANGDFYSDEPFQGSARSTHEGRCLLVIRSGREKGTVAVTARAADLPSTECIISVD